MTDALTALRPRLPSLAVELGVDGLDGVPDPGGFRVEVRAGPRAAALKVRRDDGQAAFLRTRRWALAVDAADGPLDPQLEGALRALARRLAELDDAGHELPRPGTAAPPLDLRALLTLPLATQLGRLRRDDLDAVVIDTDTADADPLAALPARTRPPRVVHLVGRDPLAWTGLPGLAARGVVAVHLPVSDPAALPDVATLRAWHVRRLVVPWPGPAAAPLRALREAGFEIVAVARAPEALADLSTLATFTGTLVAPEGHGDGVVHVVRAGLPAREPPAAFVPAAVLPPVGLDLR